MKIFFKIPNWLIWVLLLAFIAPVNSLLAAATAILGGNAVLEQSTNAALSQNVDNYARFTSSSASAVLDWAKFDIGSGQEMNFSGAGTTFFNLVNATAGRSQIDGIISGNGNVWVINPNGIAFGANSTVNVGGLFAAAAGNIENADALRSGTGTMPSFSSFDGVASSASTSKFSANQVAMLGRTVSAAGDFSGVVSLDVGAGKGVIVDDVGGGMVSVNVSQFAEDHTEVSVELGDLVVVGDFGVRSGNAIKVSGDILLGGDAKFYTKNGDVSIVQDAKVESVGTDGEVSLVAGMTVGGKGDVVVDGIVEAPSVYAYAGYGDSGVGGCGDVIVNGLIKAEDFTQIIGFGGVVDVGESGLVSAESGEIQLWGGLGVDLNGNVIASDDISVYTDSGNIFIGAEGCVHAKGVYGKVNLITGMNGYCLSDIDIKGSVLADGDNGRFWASAGYGEGAFGNFTLSGDIKVKSVAQISATGSMFLDGNVDLRDGDMYVTAANIVAPGKIRSQNAILNAYDNLIFDNKDNDFAGNVFACGSYVSIFDANNLLIQEIYSDNVLLKANGTLMFDQICALNSASFSADLGITSWGLLSVGTSATSIESKNGYIQMLGPMKVNDVYFKTPYAIVADNPNNDFAGVVSAKCGAIVLTDNNDISLGNISANGALAYTGEGKESISVLSLNGDITINSDATISSSHKNGRVDLMTTTGNIAINGDVTCVGDVFASSSVNGDISVSGDIVSEKCFALMAVDGDVSVDGRVQSYDSFVSTSKGSVFFNGSLKGENNVMVGSSNGSIYMNGIVDAFGTDGYALLNIEGDGDVVFGTEGLLKGTHGVGVLIENGDVFGSSTAVSEKNGFLSKINFAPSMVGENIIMNVNGSIGQGKYAYLPIEGKSFIYATKDVSVAAANGSSFIGGGDIGEIKTFYNTLLDDLQSLGFSSSLNVPDWDNSIIEVGGSLSIYTSDKLDSNAFFSAKDDIVVSAASFGDLSYLHAGGELTVNNVGRPAHPEIAYFESVNGVEPNIKNQPNDTVIFLDGRLAGGNLQTLNMFGANEAFLVSTPELKSSQGIFGTPPFLHSDLDVANPMEVCAIDYLIQEVPRLMLSSDFPGDVDKTLEANGLSLRDSYWFGQRRVASDKPKANMMDLFTEKEKTIEDDLIAVK